MLQERTNTFTDTETTADSIVATSPANRIVHPLFEVSQTNSQGSLLFRRGSHLNRQEEYKALPPKERLRLQRTRQTCHVRRDPTVATFSGNRIVYPLFEVSQTNSQGSLLFRRGSHLNRQEEYTALPPKERLLVAEDAPDMPCSPRSNCCRKSLKQTARAPFHFVGGPI